jgi:phage terminase large subunit
VDWGYNDPMAFYWHAVGPDKFIYTYREWYNSGYLDRKAAQEISGITGNENIEYTIGDPSSFPVKIESFKYGQISAVPRYEVWADEGIDMIMGNNARIEGWAQMRDYLEPFDYKGRRVSKWRISSQCVHLIEEITSAQRCQRRPEDVSDKSVDHAIDAARYGLFSREPAFPKKQEIISHLEAAERQAEREEDYNIKHIWE